MHCSLAQYYSWGDQPAGIRWRQLESPRAKIIFPDYAEASARRALWYLDTLSTHVDWGYTHGTMRTPVVLSTQNLAGNGMVMWAPKRIELLAAPAATYSEPWMKQLIAHEYRHNVQYNNLRRGTNRVLTWILGEQAAFLATGQFSIFALEGDAVMAETEMSAFGRGLQPGWTMHYRAVGNVGSSDKATDYWFSGSYRDYVPDHYRLGYQMVRWLYNNEGRMVWDDVARYVARNPQSIMPTPVALRRQTGFGTTQMFRRTFADLNRYWASLPRVDDSSRRVPTPWTSYTTYRWPLWTDNGTLVALKTDLDRPTRIVSVDARTGMERVLAHVGEVSSRPVLAGGRLWWTEYRGSALWDERVGSFLCSYDFAGDRKRVEKDGGLLYPTAVDGGSEMAFIRYTPGGRFSVVSRVGDGPLRTAYEFPFDTEVTGLAWDDATHTLYFIGLTDAGMYIGAVPGMDRTGSRRGSGVLGVRRVTPARHITLSDLRAHRGVLYFGSIVSGRDEAHAFDLASGQEYRLTTSRFGSFGPSPSVDGDRVALTTYDRYGYHLAVASASDASPQEPRELPLDVVNPKWRRWEGIARLDSLNYELRPGRDAKRITTRQSREANYELKPPKKFNKFTNIFRPHSWLPADFYPPDAIQEADLTLRAGATVMSQSLLSDATGWLAVGWGGAQTDTQTGAGNGAKSGGMMARGGLRYTGLGPVLDVDFTYGGASQALYTRVPEGTALKKYFSVTTRLSLPVVLSSGYWMSSVTPAAEWFYTNGLIYTPPVGAGSMANLRRGVDRLSVSLRYGGQTRLAAKEFLPRWGVAARVGYVASPTNRNFFGLWTASASAWLPGVVRPHSLTLRAGAQRSDSNPRGMFVFRMKELWPRGASWNLSSKDLAAGSVDYQLPVWYPEGGWASVVYFKRVRLNLFADFAQWRDWIGRVHDVRSLGGDVIVDLHPLRMPASSPVSLRITVAKPSDKKGTFTAFGVSVPL